MFFSQLCEASRYSLNPQPMPSLMRRLTMGSVALNLFGLCLFGASSTPIKAKTTSPSSKQPHISWANVPLSFESVGKPRRPDTFTATGEGFRVTLSPQEAVLQTFRSSAAGNHTIESTTDIHLRMLGVDPATAPSGQQPLPGSTYHFEGRNSEGWRQSGNFGRVNYRNIYRGVDLVYYGNQNQLEYDFVVSPNGDPNEISFDVAGAKRVRLDTSGNLVLTTSDGDILLGKPNVYQQVGSTRQSIAAAFHLDGTRIGFDIGAYDRKLPLVIDPTLNYSASVGRSANDKIKAIAVGVDGTTYVAGVSPAISATDHGEAFVAHISADGSTLLYLTYLGGTADTDARALVVDLAGNVYVAGETKAVDFPVMNPLQSTCALDQSQNCDGDAFLAKLNSDGSLNFATYLGGSGEDAANALALDSKGNIYVAGSTASQNFPVFQGFQVSKNGKTNAFVTKVSPNGLNVLYSTYLGGSGFDSALAIAIDSNSSAYITGQTHSADFPTINAFQAQCLATGSNGCQSEAFIAKLSPDGSTLSFSTYFGGSGGDSANAIALDAAGGILIAGKTGSSDFPVSKPIQAAFKGSGEAFVAKFLPNATGLVFSTFLGGSGTDEASSIALDSAGRAYVAGHTNSPDFPTQSPLQAQCQKDATGVCSTDSFLAVLNPSGTGLQFASYLGGSGTDEGHAIAVDTNGSVYLAGSTASLDFPRAKTAVMESGIAPSNPGPYNAVRPAAATVTAGLAVGGVVSKISDLIPSATCAGATITWTGSAGDNQWTTANNWSTKALPVASDAVCIGTSFAASTITIGSIATAANQTISSLTSNANISFTAGPLTISSGASFINALSITGGTLTLNGTSGSAVGKTMTLGSGILAGTDTLDITGLLTWYGVGAMCTTDTCGAVTGTQGVTNANGGIAGSGTQLNLFGRTLNNAGVATFSNAAGYQFYLGYGAIVNNLAGATWNLTTDFNSSVYTSGGTFNNAGLFEKTGGSTSSTISVPFNNTGTVSAAADTLNLNDVISSSGGTWNAASGAVLNLSAPVSTTSTLTGGKYSGAGVVQFGATGSGIIDIAGAPTVTVPIAIVGAVLDITAGTTMTVPTLALTTGSLSGPGTMTVTGLLTWYGVGAMCTTDTCGAVTGTQGVTNANGGIAGSGTQLNLFGRTLNNAGVATFSNAAGYQFYLGYGAIVNNLAGATWNLTTDFNSSVYTSGGTFNNAGLFEKTGGSTSSTISVPFNNTGTVSAAADTLNLNDVISSSGGTWNAASGAVLNLSAPVSTTSTLTGGKYSGAGVVQFGATGSGIIDIAGAPTVTVPIAIVGAVLDITAGTTMTVPTLALTTGSLSGPGTMTVTGLLTWYGVGAMCTTDTCGAVTGTQGVTNANGGIAGSGTQLNLFGRTLNNAGVATFSNAAGYQFYLGYGAIVNNLAGATWNLTTDFNSSVYTSGGTFNNAGLFEKTGGSTSSTISVPFNNTGTVSAAADTLNLNDVISSSGGTWNAASGAVLNLSAPVSTTSTLTGGKYSGAGVVQFGATGSGIIDIAGAPTVTVPIAIVGAVLDITAGTTMTVPTLALTTGSLSGPGTMTVTGLLTWYGVGAMCTTDTCGAVTGTQGVTNANGGIAGSGTQLNLFGRTLNNAGVATFSNAAGYQFYLGYGAIVNNLAGATWNLTTDFNSSVYTSGGTFNNAGLFEKTGGSTSSTISVPFNNTGTVSAAADTLNLNDVISSSGGTWNAASGAVLNLSAPVSTTSTLTGGKYSGAGVVQFGATGSGIIDIAGAPTVTVPIAIVGAVLDITAGTTMTVPTLALTTGSLSGPGTMTVTGLLTWYGVGAMCTTDTCGAVTGTQGVTNANGGIAGSGTQLNLFGRTLNNAGVATFSNAAGYQFYLGYGAIVNNLAGATWNLTTDFNSSVYTSGGTFNNAGLFEKTGGSTSSTISVPFNNTGTVSAAADTLAFGSTYIQTGGSTNLAGGALAFGSTPQIQGGTLAGSGTISGNYTGSISTSPAGTIAPGTATTAGAIGLTGTGSGNYTEGSGTFNVKVGGTAAGQFDTLSVSGTATLGGTLNVTIIGSYSPSSADSFVILTAAAVSGKFSVLNIPSGWTVTYNPTSVVLNASSSPHILKSIAITPTSSSIGKGQTQQFTATGTYSDGTTANITNSVTFASSNTAIATIAAGGLATGLSQGTSNITATLNGITSNSAVLTVNPATLQSIALTPTSASIGVSKTQQFTATATYSDGTTGNITGTATFASSNTAIATIAAGGLATGLSQGTTNITATLSGITSNSAVLTVNPATLQSIALTPTSASIGVSKTQQFTATATYSDGTTGNITGTATFASSNTAIATIAAGGLATGLSQGTSNITATLNGITSNSAVLTVNPATLQSIALTPTSASIGVSKTQQFTATATYSDGTTGNITGTATFASSNTAIATIAAGGLATGLSQGTSNITATLNGITSNSAVLTVNPATLQSIALTPTSASIGVSKTQQFTATATYSDGTTGNITGTATFASSNTAIATIAAGGLATGLSQGTTNITATLNGITSNSAVLTVNPATLQSIALTPTSASIGVSKTQQFTATATYSDGTTGNITGTATFASSNTAIATIAAGGLATGLSQGTSNITATLNGITSNSAVLTVNPATLQSIALTPTSASIGVSKTQQFTATATYSDGTTGNITGTATFASSNTAIATIAAGGLATGLSQGTTNITATLSGITSNSAVLTVNPATLQSIALTPTSASIGVSKTQQFTATATYSDGTTGNITGTATFASSNTAIATIAAGGLATGLSQGTTNITATLNGITSNSAVLTVNPATLQSIALTPTSASIGVSKTQQFTATATYSDGTTGNITGTATFASSNTAIATIAAGGLATGLSQGTSNITATLNGITSNSAVLTVNPATLQSIALTPTSASIGVSKTQQFTATATYSDGTTGNITGTATFASSNTAIATIAAGGLATGLSQGTTNITATLSGITSNSAVLTVNPATLQSIALTPTSASIGVSKTQQFTATATYSDGTTGNITGTATFASSNTAIATIAAGGLATGLSQGTSNITATLNGITSNSAVLTVNPATLQSIALTPTSASIGVSKTQQFTATATYSDGTTGNITGTATFASSNTAIATIAAGGLATGLSQGTTNITATLSGITSNSAVLTVNPATGGEPLITITLLGQGTPGVGYYVDLQVANTGTGPASNLNLNQINFRVLSGSGTVSLSSALPISLGSLNAGASTTIRLYLSVTGTVSRFSIGEVGTLQDASGTAFSFASSELIIY